MKTRAIKSQFAVIGALYQHIFLSATYIIYNKYRTFRHSSELRFSHCDYLNCIREVLYETIKMFGIIHQEILLY